MVGSLSSLYPVSRLVFQECDLSRARLRVAMANGEEIQRREVDALLQRLRGGDDQDAAAQLVEYLYPTVAKILQHRLPSSIAIEDVSQQVFQKVFASLHQFRGDAPLEHWVASIAVKTCLNAMRGKRMRMEVRRADLSEEQEAMLDHFQTVDSTQDLEQAIAGRELLQKLLQCLSPKERLALELTELEGNTSQEAAKLLGSNAVAVRVRVTRARAKMRKYLSKLQSAERNQQ